MTSGRILLLLLATTFGACAKLPPTPVVSAADSDPLRRAVITDVVDRLGEIYEATETRLVPARAAATRFDVALLAALRARGFVVTEPGGAGDRFDCTVEPMEGHAYRVAASIGPTRLSRLWMAEGGRAYAAGAWTRQE